VATANSASDVVEPDKSGGTDSTRLNISDPQVMRALAHPARLAIMEHLTSTGAAATATECAEVCGLSPSATSYHLRALARWGLVNEAPSRGDGRERVWRATTYNYSVNAGSDASPDARAAEKALVEVFIARDDGRVRRWLERAHDEPREWYEAATLSESMLLLTADELTELNEKLAAVLRPYRRRERLDNPPEGARLVAAIFRTIPAD
jgi:DNA-binding transcriptional ArsR family regulator